VRNIVLLFVLLFPMMSWAADQPIDIKPGLWEITMTSQTSGVPPIPNLDQMTPEQRARIEAAMKGLAGPRTTTARKCITRDDIQKAIAEASSGKNNSCSPKLVSSSASKLVLRVDCSSDRRDTKSSGAGRARFRRPERRSGGGADD
jgi:hypothetical protein